jgi:hypothetical protein
MQDSERMKEYSALMDGEMTFFDLPEPEFD